MPHGPPKIKARRRWSPSAGRRGIDRAIGRSSSANSRTDLAHRHRALAGAGKLISCMRVAVAEGIYVVIRRSAGLLRDTYALVERLDDRAAAPLAANRLNAAPPPTTAPAAYSGRS